MGQRMGLLCPSGTEYGLESAKKRIIPDFVMKLN